MQDKNVPGQHDYFMLMLPHIASRSKDPHTKVGVVIVGDDGAVRTTGYNGLVRGINDDIDERWSRENREKDHWCEHAERNAIYSGARNGVALLGCTMYLSLAPCVDCARAIVQAGITQVVLDADRSFEARVAHPVWGESYRRARQTLREAGVNLIYWKAKSNV